ncbi:neuronal acetylcholine receptor subunit alpha-3 [Plakobranchus ocellatus]|uniref:Neuronal acetylcholine receptor subunit alpha-3 n=1 Tax=Plakobranchus ocellatus TaxID=259542 RepID=A0AAV3YMV8_9GAST|nr:neuronal acetylcholine receptor subunit alpha-3 [Plakobranchus ocellatus]
MAPAAAVMLKITLIVCLTLCFPSPAGGTQGKAEYEALVAALFNGYDSRIRPTLLGGPTFIRVMFEPLSIINLDETGQVLYTYAKLYVQWSDEVLAWNRSDYSGIENFLWPQSDVWLPDLIISNSVEKEEAMGYKDMPVRIHYDGIVEWNPSSIFQTSCDLDVTYYPFDTQVCSVIMSTKMSTFEDIRIITDSNSPISMAEYSPGGTWDLQSITPEGLANVGDITRFQFKLTLKRLRTYYVMNIILPVLFLSFTASIVFYLPADAGEKIGMSMTVLLAYAVYLTIIADNMPQTSLQVSLLAVYLTILLAFTALGVILSVVVLNLHHTSDEIPVGRKTTKITRLVRHYLRLGLRPALSDNQVAPICKTPATTLTDADYTLSKNHQHPPLDTKVGSGTLGLLGQHNVGYKTCNSRLSKSDAFGSCSSTATSNDENELETITWPKVAEAVDRVLFISFSSFVFFITIILLPYMAAQA